MVQPASCTTHAVWVTLYLALRLAWRRQDRQLARGKEDECSCDCLTLRRRGLLLCPLHAPWCACRAAASSGGRVTAGSSCESLLDVVSDTSLPPTHCRETWIILPAEC